MKTRRCTLVAQLLAAMSASLTVQNEADATFFFYQGHIVSSAAGILL